MLSAQTEKQKQLERERQELLNQISQINKLRQTNKRQEINVLNQVEDLSQKIKAREDLIRVTNKQANLLTGEINKNLEKISALRDELEKLKQEYAALVLKSYKSKSSQSRIMFLLSSKSFTQAYKRVQYLKQYNNYRKKQGEQIQERAALLQETNRKLAAQKAEKEQLIAENKKEQAQLQEEKKQQDGLMATIKKKESTYAGQINSKQRAADRIDKEIDRIIREAIAASNKKTGNTSTTKGSTTTFALTPEARALANDFASNKGKLPWPVESGRIYKKFGTSRHPTLSNITTYNSGVEIETEPGSLARSAFKGTVFKIQSLPGANFAVYVRHGNYITVYQNLINLQVSVDQQIAVKQAIGAVAKDTFTGKTILKFVVYKDSERQNPAEWINSM
ncbi:murein hydrolase activator EnvC family protein [Flavimarina sp. Hel_I_48]|uniref:murein hydrolase activator EnvC family protein n=1 Tax=Flavimarina sp. Hel_I_48 TaxID=1392488 RepID=UPI0009DE7EBF|nr:peptidoglycan DD-metalloendopeptidase family protein [Flavimarina sp. Hel_I_48]